MQIWSTTLNQTHGRATYHRPWTRAELCYTSGMSVVEDVRQVLQDFLAPELREIKGRIEALEKQMEDIEEMVSQRFADLRSYLDMRFNSVDNEIGLSNRVAKMETELRAIKRQEDKQ